MKKILLILSFTLCSCVSFPPSEESLAASGTKSKEICSNLTTESLQSHVEKYLSKCFRWTNISMNGVNISANFYVSKKSTQNGATYLVTMPRKKEIAHLLSVKVEKSSGECNSTINGYAYNFMWGRHFGKLETVAKGENAYCPI